MNTTRHECIVSSCDWSHTRPDLDPGALTVDAAQNWRDYEEQIAADDKVIREHFETHTLEEWAREVAMLREQLRTVAELAPAPPQQVFTCTPCLGEAKQATMRGIAVPEVFPAAVIAGGMGLCEQRHGIQVEPTLIRAAPGQMPVNGFGG